MPEEINGYELFQYCLGKEPGEAISFSELENSLGDGYFSQVLFGSATGNRRWTLNYPYLPGASAQASVTVNGVIMTPEAYIWDLFCRQKRTGRPFVIKSARNEQYYLAKFAQRELEYTRYVTKLYSSTLELEQVRVDDVTVFDIGQMPNVWGWYDAAALDFGDGLAIDKSSAGHDLTIHGDVIVSDTDVSFNSLLGEVEEPGGDGGYLNWTGSMSFREGLFVIKNRGPVWENHGGILTAAADTAVLVGLDETTKFYNLELGATFKYRKNWVEYAQANQQAPMEEYGLVHVRSSAGITLLNPQIGKDRNFAGRFARVDMKEIVLFNAGLPESDLLECSDALMTRWNLH